VVRPLLFDAVMLVVAITIMFLLAFVSAFTPLAWPPTLGAVVGAAIAVGRRCLGGHPSAARHIAVGAALGLVAEVVFFALFLTGVIPFHWVGC